MLELPIFEVQFLKWHQYNFTPNFMHNCSSGVEAANAKLVACLFYWHGLWHGSKINFVSILLLAARDAAR